LILEVTLILLLSLFYFSFLFSYSNISSDADISSNFCNTIKAYSEYINYPTTRPHDNTRDATYDLLKLGLKNKANEIYYFFTKTNYDSYCNGNSPYEFFKQAVLSNEKIVLYIIDGIFCSAIKANNYNLIDYFLANNYDLSSSIPNAFIKTYQNTRQDNTYTFNISSFNEPRINYAQYMYACNIKENDSLKDNNEIISYIIEQYPSLFIIKTEPEQSLAQAVKNRSISNYYNRTYSSQLDGAIYYKEEDSIKIAATPEATATDLLCIAIINNPDSAFQNLNANIELLFIDTNSVHCQNLSPYLFAKNNINNISLASNIRANLNQFLNNIRGAFIYSAVINPSLSIINKFLNYNYIDEKLFQDIIILFLENDNLLNKEYKTNYRNILANIRNYNLDDNILSLILSSFLNLGHTCRADLFSLIDYSLRSIVNQKYYKLLETCSINTINRLNTTEASINVPDSINLIRNDTLNTRPNFSTKEASSTPVIYTHRRGFLKN